MIGTGFFIWVYGMWRFNVRIGFLLIAIGILGLFLTYLFAGGDYCPSGQTYQVVRYEPQFNGAKMPVYKPIYGCK